MPIVTVRDEEHFENALRRFKRKCEKSGILTELKKRQYFEKPCVKRKRKDIQAPRRCCVSWRKNANWVCS